MLRLGGTASPGHITVFRGLKTHFQQQGIALEWVLYADYDALVEAFATREIDLAWNGPISYVHIKQRLNDPCRVVAMRDVDINFRTQLFTRRDSSITTLADLKGKRVALGSRGSAQAGLLPYYFLKQHGLDPQRDLAAYTFAEDREPSPLSDERAVRARPADAGHPPRLLVEPRVQPLLLYRASGLGCGSRPANHRRVHLDAIHRPAGQRGAGRRGLPGVCARHHDRLGGIRKCAQRANPLTDPQH